MKFRILLLLLALATFGLCTAQSTSPPDDPLVETVGLPSDEIVEDIMLVTDLNDRGPLASNLQADPNPDPDPNTGGDDPFDLWAWLTTFIARLIPESVIGYFGAFLLVGETVTRLTPTKEDDKWFLWVKRIIDTIFPSRQKGGGTFPKADKTPI